MEIEGVNRYRWCVMFRLNKRLFPVARCVSIVAGYPLMAFDIMPVWLVLLAVMGALFGVQTAEFWYQELLSDGAEEDEG